MDKSRLFRVQFSGESKEQALEHCCSCVQKLAQYITVQVPDGNIQELQLNPGPCHASESQGKNSAKSVPWQHGCVLFLSVHLKSYKPWSSSGHSVAFLYSEGDKSSSKLGPIHCMQAAMVTAPVSVDAHSPGMQTLLASEELPRVYEQSAWGAEELGPFLRLCLMDQNFPAFVEDVEKELKKLAGLSN
ncbi:hypothetical protein P7K49_017153 [Saguinus oedipus]|uniref:REC114 meiotic recombination protein n=1 Tax=Saguinus oedipus TaxID=9490 RepID=A0ABQ9V4E0_SAGOE|nr:hypothetical protein P7K49_017153 [Saguinus oedipus]